MKDKVKLNKIERFLTDEFLKTSLCKYSCKEGVFYTSKKDWGIKICSICKTKNSVKKGTIFEGVRFGVIKAFDICKEATEADLPLTAKEVSKRYYISLKTSRKFLRRIASEEASINRMVEGIMLKKKQRPKKSNEEKLKEYLLTTEVLQKGI